MYYTTATIIINRAIPSSSFVSNRFQSNHFYCDRYCLVVLSPRSWSKDALIISLSITLILPFD